MTTSKGDKAKALRELLGVEVKFEALSAKDIDLLFALMGDPATLAERIASGIAKDKVRAAFEGLAKEWRPGMLLQMLQREE